MQRNPVENLDVGAPSDDQALDDVEAIQLRTTGRNLRKIPSSRRSRPAHPPAAVQGSTAFQDAPDRPQRGQRANMPPLKLPADRGRPILAQSTGLLQFASQRYQEILQLRRRLVDRLAASGKPVRPVDAIDPSSFRPPNPSLNQRSGNAKPSRNRVERVTRSHRCNHRTALGSARVPTADFSPMIHLHD